MGSIICATGTYFPTTVVTNKDLEKILALSGESTSDEWIVKRTGIKNRRVAGPSETLGSMAVCAAKDALDCLREDIPPIDHIILATNTNDRNFPNISSYVQAEIRATCPDRIRPDAGFADVSSGCAGTDVSLKYADALVRSGIHRTVLVLGVDKLSSISDYADRGTCILFEDGASADIISGTAPDYGFLGHHDRGDGSKRELLRCENLVQMVSLYGALAALKEGRKPDLTLGRKIHMEGSEVYKYVDEAWDQLITGFKNNRELNPQGISFEDVGYLNPHLANLRCFILKDKKYPGFLKKCGLDVESEDFCNSSTASQGKRRKEFVEQASPGSHLLIFGYGAALYDCASLYKKPAF